MSGGWHVWHAGRLMGPWSGEAMLEACRNGDFPTTALAREAEDDDWIPLNRLFSKDELKVPVRPNLTSVRLRIITLAVIGAAAAWLVLSILLIFTYVLETATINYRWLWAFAGLGGFVSLGAAAVLGWRWLARLAPAASESVAMLRIALVIAAVAGCVFHGIVLRSAPYASEVTLAKALMRNYSLEYLDASNTLLVSGEIGPGIDVALAKQLRSKSIDRIEINSSGGLIWEAMEMARLIQPRNLTVVARGQCDSACLIVLMSGAHREADYDLALGFHATSPLLSEVGPRVPGDHTNVADRYLIERGVPREIVAQANALGSYKLNYVYAVDLMETGAITGLRSGEGRVSASYARFALSVRERTAASSGQPVTPEVPASPLVPPS